MFHIEQRERLRERLISAAQEDAQIDAAALLGSAARAEEDAWSDIDLALRLAPGVAPHAVAEQWGHRLSLDETVVDHLDIAASGALYRVFLLASTLQVDLSFWPHGHFVTGGSPIRLLFGEADDTSVVDRGEEGMHHLRMTWLYALRDVQ